MSVATIAPSPVATLIELPLIVAVIGLEPPGSVNVPESVFPETWPLNGSTTENVPTT